MGEIRAFIAIVLPDEVKNELSEILYKLKPGREKTVKWVHPNGIHLTLKFLGNTPEEKIVDITQAIAKASSSTHPFNLELKGLGAFPNLKSPRVAWVGIKGDIPSVTNLQRQVDQSLIPLGFTRENRQFSPHLTLGRVRDKASKSECYELGRTIETLKIPRSPSFLVDRISIIQSTLTRSGAIYNQLATVVLDMN